MTQKPSERIEEIQNKLIKEYMDRMGIGGHKHDEFPDGMFREEAILQYLDEQAEKEE